MTGRTTRMKACETRCSTPALCTDDTFSGCQGPRLLGEISTLRTSALMWNNICKWGKVCVWSEIIICGIKETKVWVLDYPNLARLPALGWASCLLFCCWSRASRPRLSPGGSVPQPLQSFPGQLCREPQQTKRCTSYYKAEFNHFEALPLQALCCWGSQKVNARVRGKTGKQHPALSPRGGLYRLESPGEAPLTWLPFSLDAEISLRDKWVRGGIL